MKLSNKISYALIVLALVGLVDATYLTVKHYTGEPLECSLVAGCEAVLNSGYSMVLGVPVALGGVLYYASIFLLVYYIMLTQSEKLFKLLGVVVVGGMLATIYFVSLQVFVIKSICQYCMISAVVTTILVIIMVRVWLKSTNEIKK